MQLRRRLAMLAHFLFHPDRDPRNPRDDCTASFYTPSGPGTPCVLKLGTCTEMVSENKATTVHCRPHSSTATAGTRANPRCPCVNLSTANLVPHDDHAFGPVGNASAQCADGLLRLENGRCYPSNFGSGMCLSHDMVHNASECRGSNPKSWCDDSWCFVDPSNCERENMPSKFFPHLRLKNSSAPSLMYSYTTCGNIDTFTAENENDHPFAKQLHSYKDGRLRITFPGHYSSDVMRLDRTRYTGLQNGNIGKGRTLEPSECHMEGSFVEFFQRSMAKFGVTTFEIVPLSSAAGATTGSPWSHCLYGIALNNTDVCLGPTWPTLERQFKTGFQGAGFSIPLYEDAFKMVSKRKPASARTVFWPLVLWTAGGDGSGIHAELTPEKINENLRVWLTILGMLLYTGIVLFVLEGHTNDEVYPESHSPGLSVIRSLFNSLQSFVGMGDYRHTPQTHDGRLGMITSSFAVLILITTYTSLITSGLVAKPEQAGVYASVNDAIAKGAKFCETGGEVGSRFSAEYPEAIGDPIGCSQPTNDEPSRGEQNPIIMSDVNWRESTGVDRCKLVRDAATVFTMPATIPIRKDILGALSWALGKHIATGEHAAIRKKWVAKNVKALPCTGEEEGKEEEDAFVFVEFAVNTSFYGSTVPLIWFLFKECRRWIRRKQKTPKELKDAKFKLQEATLAERLFCCMDEQHSVKNPAMLAKRRASKIFERNVITGDSKTPTTTSSTTNVASALQNESNEKDKNSETNLMLIQQVMKTRNDALAQVGTKLKADMPLTVADLPMMLALFRNEPTTKHPMIPSTESTSTDENGFGFGFN